MRPIHVSLAFLTRFACLNHGQAGVYGIQYDSSVTNQAKSRMVQSFHFTFRYSNGPCLDWTMFTAGASNDSTLRDTLISLVHTKAGSNISAGLFPLTYDPNEGTSISGQARYAIPIFASADTNRLLISPGHGAMFSLMTLRYVWLSMFLIYR